MEIDSLPRSGPVFTCVTTPFSNYSQTMSSFGVKERGCCPGVTRKTQRNGRCKVLYNSHFDANIFQQFECYSGSLKVPKANRLPMSWLMGGQSTFNVHLCDFSLRRQAPDVSGKRELDICFLRHATSADAGDIHFTSSGTVYSCHIHFLSCYFRVILIHTSYMLLCSAVWQGCF